MKNITDRQEKQHQIEDYAAQIKHNCGKDRFDKGKSFWKSYTTGGKGKVSNLMLDTGYALPALLETQMLNHWRRENPVMPNIYAANKYAPIALQTMAGNRVSANPVLENYMHKIDRLLISLLILVVIQVVRDRLIEQLWLWVIRETLLMRS